jgi:hypothetical protein
MPVEEFIIWSNLPAEWEGAVYREMLTGCSNCGRRLLSVNNQGTYVLDGTVILRVFDEDDILVAAYAVCESCQPCIP